MQIFMEGMCVKGRAAFRMAMRCEALDEIRVNCGDWTESDHTGEADKIKRLIYFVCTHPL